MGFSPWLAVSYATAIKGYNSYINRDVLFMFVLLLYRYYKMTFHYQNKIRFAEVIANEIGQLVPPEVAVHPRVWPAPG